MSMRDVVARYTVAHDDTPDLSPGAASGEPARAVQRVLHLSLTFHEGGRWVAIRNLVRGLHRHGVDSHLASLEVGGAPGPGGEGEVEGYVALDRQRLFDVEACRRLMRYCRAQDITLVHSHDGASQFTVALARYLGLRCAHVSTFHRSLGFESATRRARLRNAFALTRTERVVTGSRERRDHYLATNYVSSRKVACVPLGIDVHAFAPDPKGRLEARQALGVAPQEVIVGVIGHLGPEKGVDQVVRAMLKIAGRPGVPWRLVIAGDGPKSRRRWLEALAADLGRRVKFLGFQPDVSRWLQAFDLLAHAPRMEAFGLAVVEAMATALPVVATRVGGLVDVVRHGTTGLIVPVDSTDDLCDALVRLIDNPAVRSTMGENARRVAVTEYELGLYAQRYLDIYERVLGPRAAGSAV